MFNEEFMDEYKQTLEAVKDKNLLHKEFDHLNKLLEEYETDRNKSIRWFLGWFFGGAGAFLTWMSGGFFKLPEPQITIPFLGNLGLAIILILILLFLVNVSGSVQNYKKLHKRKSIVIKLLGNLNVGEINT